MTGGKLGSIPNHAISYTIWRRFIMTKTETEKQTWYDKAAEAWGFDYSKTLTIDEVVDQLNRAEIFSNPYRWCADEFKDRTELVCEGTTVYVLYKNPQRFVATGEKPLHAEGSGMDLDDCIVFGGYAPYELAIIYKMMKKENWENWFKTK